MWHWRQHLLSGGQQLKRLLVAGEGRRFYFALWTDRTAVRVLGTELAGTGPGWTADEVQHGLRSGIHIHFRHHLHSLLLLHRLLRTPRRLPHRTMDCGLSITPI